MGNDERGGGVNCFLGIRYVIFYDRPCLGYGRWRMRLIRFFKTETMLDINSSTKTIGITREGYD